MNNIFNSKIKTVVFSIVMLGVGFSGVSLLVFWMNRLQSNINAKHAAEVSIQTQYNLAHPEIIGTNENGKIIKRYKIPYGATIYEIENTQTTITPNGKFAPKVTVIYSITN